MTERVQTYKALAAQIAKGERGDPYWAEFPFGKTSETVTRARKKKWPTAVLRVPQSRSQKQLRDVFQLQAPFRFWGGELR